MGNNYLLRRTVTAAKVLCISFIFVSTQAMAGELDVTSKPPGVLSPSQSKKLWAAYKVAKECFAHPTYGRAEPLKLRLQSQADFRKSAWISPFRSAKGSRDCATGPGSSLVIPKAIKAVRLNEAYGARQGDVDRAAYWFRNMTSYYRFSGDPVAAELLKRALIDWASENALGKGIRVSWGARPVDYQMMATIFSLLNAAASIAPDFSADERALVGPWLNKLIKQSANSYWMHRQDNKAYMRTSMALIWGLMTGDEAAANDAIHTYKLAIHDMRPDGSWPIDSQRSGMGLDYNAKATSHLLMMTLTLKQVKGVHLDTYSVDGRSIHTAVEFVLKGFQAPSETNKQYAIPCPDGGDHWGSVGNPSLHYQHMAGYLLAYTQHFSDRSVSPLILEELGFYVGALDAEYDGGAVNCLFTTQSANVKLKPLVLPGD